MKLFIAAGAFILFVVPYIAHAQDAPSFSGVKLGVEASRERISLRRDPRRDWRDHDGGQERDRLSWVCWL